MPDFSPQARAQIDQNHASAKKALRLFVEQAKAAVAEHGPIDAPYYVAEWHIAIAAGPDQVDGLAGALGLALVELAQREVPDAP